MKYPTTEQDGAITFALASIHREVARRLEALDGTAPDLQRDLLLSIYVQLSILKADTFYGK